MTKSTEPKKLLQQLNNQYLKVHQEYEKLFWKSYMGDHSVDKSMDKALAARNNFAANAQLRVQVADAIKVGNDDEKVRLTQWLAYFDCYQTPAHLKKLREKISGIETKIKSRQTSVKEGYLDPQTKKFIKASRLKMRGMVRTHQFEEMRRASWEGLQRLAPLSLKEYVQRAKLLNQYANELGFEDFYAFKIFTEEGMTKKELFKIFGDIYEKTKYAFKDVRDLEKKQPGLRKPWNFGYMMSGDFTKESDPYFPFDQALARWGASFAALGIDYQGGTIAMDLLDREGKYPNGFCHWPTPVHFLKNKRYPAAAGMTCTVVYGQIGSAAQGYNTLFHEGGHAAHYANSEQTEVCMNQEYPPSSTAWAETQSMFLDTIYASIEWKARYAKNDKGNQYPFNLFERKIRRLHVLNPLGLMGIIAVSQFEKMIYEEKNLTEDKVIKIAKQINKKYFDSSVDDLWLLDVPHIYGWEATCSYHGYGLAELALSQWREYFYKKYGYIVDNPNIGKEMKEVWKLGASKTFKEFVLQATGKHLSADAVVRDMTMSQADIIKQAKSRIARLKKVPEFKGPIDLKATILMQSKLKIVASNKKSFADMTAMYAKWLEKQKQD